MTKSLKVSPSQRELRSSLRKVLQILCAVIVSLNNLSLPANKQRKKKKKHKPESQTSQTTYTETILLTTSF